MTKKKEKTEDLARMLTAKSYIDRHRERKLQLQLETLFDEGCMEEATPSMILAAAMLQVYDPDYSPEKFSRFQEIFMKGLSRLSTGGRTDMLFQGGFDAFFESYVKSMNNCAKMYQLLKDHGIDYDLGLCGQEGNDNDIA